MQNINKIFITGNVTKDPEFIEGNTQILKFGVANNNYGDKVSFFDCVVFGKFALAIKDYIKKGTNVTIQGRMQQEKYQKDGQNRYSWSLIVEELHYNSPKKQESSVQESTEDIPF